MKYKFSAVIGMGTPSDGLDDTEKELQRVIQEESLKTLYSKLPTSRMKFVVAAHFDLGMSQQLVADILGIQQPSLQDEINHIKRVLSGKPYKPHKHKGTVKIEDVMKAIMYMAKP